MKIFKSLFITLFFMVFFIGTANASNYNVITNISDMTLNVGDATAGSLNKEQNSSYFDYKPNKKYSNFTLYFDNLNIPKNTSYFTIPFSIVNKNNDKYYNCTTEYIDNSQQTQFEYKTTYADGSTSNNKGSATTYGTFRYCQSFKSDNDEIALDATYKLTDSARYNCNIIGVNNNFELVCPVPNNKSDGDSYIYYINFNMITNETNNYNTYDIRFANYINSFLDSNAQMIDQQQETNKKVDNINNSINSSNTSGGESAADDLKNNSAFQDNSGLSSVVSMPLTFVNSLSNTCQPISLNIPYFDVDIQIPCLQSIITEKMPALANIIKVVINGFIIYRVLLDIFQIIRNAKNPEDDRIEVLDL